jgi:TolB-like protein/tetratricopeptide (TPR) repeat protein
MAPEEGAPTGGRLESWKEIAAYLGRGVSTVQRWEREEGLPVHRHLHKKRGSAYALREEVDAWWSQRAQRLGSEAPGTERRRVYWWGAAAAVAAVAIVAGAVVSLSPAAPAAVRTLAVLPLANATGGAESDYLADGLTEGLIEELSTMAGVRVMGRDTSFRYKDTGVEPREAGRALRADAVLSGSVASRGSAVEVAAELVSVADGSRVWQKRYSAEPTTLASLPQRIRSDVARRLGVPETPARRQHAVDEEIYRLCLRGRYFWNKRTPEGLERSIELYREAIRRDQLYADAWRGLADAYNILAEYTETSEAEAFPAARHAASRALALDPDRAGAHASLGFVLFWWDRDAAGAEAEFRRALELNPNHATAHHWYGNVLLSLDRIEEALDHLQAAHRSDPLALIIGAELGAALYHARRHDEAVERLRSTIELDPGFAEAHYWLTRTLLAKGDLAGALAEAELARKLYVRPNAMLAEMGLAHARGARPERARECLELLEEQRGERPVSYALSILYAGLGETAEALEALERAAHERSTDLSFMSTDPVFDPLRGEPRFREIQSRLRRPRSVAGAN